MSIMDLGELEQSIAESRHVLSTRSTNLRDDNEELEPNYSDGHENYHALHLESLDKVTATEEDEDVFSEARGVPTNRSKLTTPFKQALFEMKERISFLEKKLASVSNNEDDVGDITALNAMSGVETTYGNGVKDAIDEQQIIPEVHGRSWSDFMNKYAKENSEYAIEALVGEPQYHHQHSRDTGKGERRQGDKRSLRPLPKVHTNVSSSDDTSSIPERIRINSPLILNVLASISRTIDATGPVVMLRPFKFLVHYENRIKDEIRALEDRVADAERRTLLSASTESPTSEQPNPMIPQHIENSQRTLQHMKCLSDFIDERIRPTIDRLQRDSAQKIQFRDLWYVFGPGEDIYMPLRLPRGRVVSVEAMTTTPETFQSRYQMLWRVTGTAAGRPNLSVAESRNVVLSKLNPFKVNCYYIDFDGKYFCPIIHSFSIMPFKGERDITSLDFFPVRFLQASRETFKAHADKGKMIFRDVATFKHHYYAGPTLVVHPCGCPLQHDPLHQDHVESEIIVDFRVTLIKNPGWRPKVTAWKQPPVERREVQESCQVRYWKDLERTKLENTEHDQIYDDSYIDRESSTIFRNNEQIFAPIPSGWLSNESMVPEKDGGLLPGRVFAFVLRTRTFAPLWLWRLQPIRPQTDGLRNLQLRDNSFKETVQALVKTHFMQKTMEAKSEFDNDVVHGKGKGLVILLHGAPGVGKTLTAESVAAANGKPLFQITCGDLGLTPGEVDRALKEIFRFAQLWDCVLLLDEADIFLAQRSKNDIVRNSLVSVFLRVLEYYTGVLFLTTNRVGTLDDAFKSRITWNAYYPPLDEQQTKNIWKVNVKRLAERNEGLDIDRKGIMNFAKEHFQSNHAKGFTWNGRQIQNAFKVATALAEWDALGKDMKNNTDTRIPDEMSRRPKLSASQFKTIANGTLAFERYLQETTGSTEIERAYNAMERADNYDEDNVNDNGFPQNPEKNQSFGPPQWQQRPMIPSPQPFQSPPLLQTRRRSSNQSPGLQINMPSPRSRRSSQLTAVASVDPQSPHMSRSSSYANQTNNAKPININLRPAQQRHRSSSNSGLVDPLSQSYDEGLANGSVSSSGDGDDDWNGGQAEGDSPSDGDNWS